MSDKDKQKRCVRCGYTKAWHGRVDGAPDHGFVPDYEDIITEARALTKNMIEGTPRNLIIALADEVEQIRELVVHMHVHSGYRNNGYLQMTKPQKALYDAIWERSVAELDAEEASHAKP